MTHLHAGLIVDSRRSPNSAAATIMEVHVAVACRMRRRRRGVHVVGIVVATGSGLPTATPLLRLCTKPSGEVPQKMKWKAIHGPVPPPDAPSPTSSAPNGSAVVQIGTIGIPICPHSYLLMSTIEIGIEILVCKVAQRQLA
jgi:hypothetical protein